MHSTRPVCGFFAALLLIAGCASRPTVRYDDFDRAEIAQSSGNYVSGRYAGKTVLALNPRRETRRIEAVTNTVITFHTNQVKVVMTNLAITFSTNFTTALSTNDNPPAPPAPAPAETTAATDAAEDAASPVDTNAPPAVAAAPTNAPVVVVVPPPLTNETVTAGLNVSAILGNNQLTETAQRVSGLLRQISVVTNNQTITTQLNELVTVETNRNLTTVTNTVVTAVTNVTVVATNLAVHDTFLFTELIAPSDFTLAPGESLVLLIDGERFAFAQTNSPAAFTTRKPFTSTLYRVPPDVFGRIASANRVRVRLKGQSSVIERDLPKGTQVEFKEFVEALERLDNPPPAEPPKESAAAKWAAPSAS